MSDKELHSFLDEIASQPAICRTCYGENEPMHLPKSDYYWDRWVGVWMESDESLRRRAKERIIE
jgi:hypothetical protein